MKRISDDELKGQFLAWQCRIRQMAMRQHGGRPMPGMRPRVLSAAGEVIMPAMTVLIIPVEPHREHGVPALSGAKVRRPPQGL
jgi:hypothetical protein